MVEFEREGNGREWEESIVVEMVREVTEEESNLRARRGQGSNQGNLRKFGSNSSRKSFVQISLFCAIPLLLIDEAESLIVESSLSDSDEQNRNQQTIRVLRVHWTDCALLRCLSFDRPGLHRSCYCIDEDRSNEKTGDGKTGQKRDALRKLRRSTSYFEVI